MNETNHLSGEYHQEVTGLFSLTAYYFQWLKAIYGFDYHMAHGTMIADYLVPIIAIFAGLNLHKRLRSTFALSAFRKGNYRQALITDVLKESCRTSLAESLGLISIFSRICWVSDSSMTMYSCII